MSGSASYSPAKLAKFARRKKMNMEVVYVFYAIVLAMMMTFVFLHWIQQKFSRYHEHGKSTSVSRIVRRCSRMLRRITVRTVLGFPSIGHALVIAIYLILDVVCSFIHMDNQNMDFLANFSSRMGWLSMANMLVLVFLALKNTPLGWLSGWSYERLNIFHQVAGYAAVVHAILHGCAYSAYFGNIQRLSKLRELRDIFGIVAGFAFFTVAFAAVVIRRKWYEMFYVIHVSFWMLSIIMIALHQPDFGALFIYITIVSAAIWMMDRLIRIIRLVVYSTNNTVTLTPLPNNGTRVTLPKAPIGAVPGKHCFLWIPKIRTFETHPFTIANKNPLQFVVAAYDGFTQDLHQFALQNPGVTLRASVEGAYGSFPCPTKFDKVILIAGGSGASFAFGVASDILNRRPGAMRADVSLVWAVRKTSTLSWYTESLEALRDDDRFSASLFVTRRPPFSSGNESDQSCEKLPTKACINVLSIDSSPSPTSSSTGSEFEKSTTIVQPSASLDDASPSQFCSFPVVYNRPQSSQIILNARQNVNKDSRILVMACGPPGLMDEVRHTIAGCSSTPGAEIELHCEQFGW